MAPGRGDVLAIGNGAAILPAHPAGLGTAGIFLPPSQGVIVQCNVR